MRQKPRLAEIVVASVTVLLWATVLVRNLPAFGWILAFASTLATFAVSSRHHPLERRASPVARIIVMLLILLVFVWLGYLTFVSWAMRDWTF